MYAQPLPRTDFKLPLLAAMLLAGLGIVFAIRVGTVTHHPHADSRHGLDAEAVRKCITLNGAEEIFRSRTQPDKYYLLVELPDGNWGLQIVRKGPGCLNEVTSFIPKDGTKARVMNYILKFASRFVGDF